MTDEFETFQEYAKVVKLAIESIIHDYNMGNGVEKVQTIYATPPAAFAKYSQETINGSKPGPLVSFYMSDINIDQSQQLGGWKILNVNNEYKFRAPVIAKLSYTVTINAIKESQADLLQTQLIMAMPYHRPYATELNGQWVVMTASNPQNLSSVDIGTDEDKISRRQLTIEIERAYFNHPIKNIERFIEDFNVNIFSVDSSKESI